MTEASKREPSKLKPWLGEPRRFSYLAEVQPVLDSNCIKCHDFGKKGAKKIVLAGDKNFSFNISYCELQSKGLTGAIGAGPALIIDGEIRITSDEEVFFGTSIPKTHPRTAAGYTKNGALIFMVVDGRQGESRGVSLDELAILMYELGAVEAINLDGGGSSTLVVDNTLVNRPAGGTTEREVMSAIATFAK